MAHFAKLGINGKVLAIHVVADKDCQNADGIEDEEVGRQFLTKIHYWSLWKQTSYNTYRGKHKNGGTPFRGNYAGIGMFYDDENDIFIEKKPFPSWTLDISTASWNPPEPKPNLTTEQKTQNQDNTHNWVYSWNEDNLSWDLQDTYS